MNRNQVAASVAKRKEERPELFCPQPKCLWRTGGGYCPRHQPTSNLHPIFENILKGIAPK